MTDNLNNINLKNLLEETGLLKNAVFEYDLSKMSSIKSGGICKCYIRVDKRADLINFLNGFISAGKFNMGLYPVGKATNILFNDGFLNLLVLELGKDFDYIDFKDSGKINAGAAFKLQKLVVETAKKGYDFSFLSGIPGTLGGAVMGSSGTHDTSINSMIKKIKYITVSNNIARQEEMQVTDLDYSYRKFNIQGFCIITDIFLEYKPSVIKNFSSKSKARDASDGTAVSDKEIILKKIRNNIKIKKNKQPLNTRNAGCVFKNPQNSSISAGRIIDACGFKGFKYGGAQVSELHANFIINACSASSKDIYVLSEIIKETVKQQFNIELEHEIKLAGF